MKHGVVGFVRALAKRHGRDNIRVNAICPGATDTPMLREFVARPDQQSTAGMDKEDLVLKRGGQNPLGRVGQPEELANAALFLISDEASFVTGAALPVDGGPRRSRTSRLAGTADGRDFAPFIPVKSSGRESNPGYGWAFELTCELAST